MLKTLTLNAELLFLMTHINIQSGARSELIKNMKLGEDHG
jgi:hypothetical protein